MEITDDSKKVEPISSYDGSVLEGTQTAFDSDDAYLKSLGKTAELHRVYNFWTLCAYQVMISATWTCVVVLYGTIFDVGGPAALLYGSIIVAIGQTLLMASLAEYCGIWPTAGGQQFYVQKLATQKYRPFLSYLVGCSVGAAFTILGFFGWAITLLAMSPKASTKFVFTKLINNSGYSSNGWVFILSFYNPLYGLYGTDSMMHLVEEMKDASRDAPRAMVWSMVLSGLATIITDLILLFCCGNYSKYVTALSPYVDWFSDMTRSEYGGIYFAVVFGVVNLLVCTGILSSCSRLGWRMAQDKAFPWSHRLEKLDQKLEIPLNFIFAIMAVEVAMGLISLGSDLAFNAIVSGAGACFALAYAIPVATAIVRGRSVLPPRPHFDLGRWGNLVNYVSVVWALLTVVIYVMPLYLPVTGDNIGNMNWAALIVGATFLFSGCWWVFRARFRYLKDTDNVPVSVVEEHSGSP
ncbi:choline permease [Fusarium austroafricanum]|uniref:Choline permease n=1 Tax=Fusarium austroafricanum TaxID=2364996 RepID=A0A8H4JSP6_9HYPO|nr:choline permease [Fusarium austroafricanum]